MLACLAASIIAAVRTCDSARRSRTRRIHERSRWPGNLFPRRDCSASSPRRVPFRWPAPAIGKLRPRPRLDRRLRGTGRNGRSALIALWRAMPSGAADEFLAAVELVVSVRTRVARQSVPNWPCKAWFRQGEVLRLQSLDPVAWAPLCPTTAAPMMIGPDSGTGCLLFRLPGSDLSYVEMVHPADFQYDELRPRRVRRRRGAHRPSVVSHESGKRSDPPRPGAGHLPEATGRRGRLPPNAMPRLPRRSAAGDMNDRHDCGVPRERHCRRAVLQCHKSHDRHLHYREFPAAERPGGGLYHRYARDLPIIDYHCHLPPGQMAEDRRFENLTQIWLYGDHYKWRAMRAAGVPERYCTGDASDWEKFQKWAETVPQTLRNPLYHWTHLELKRPLGISDRLLGPETAEGIWQRVQREAGPARVLLPRHHAADERRAGLHDGRSDRHAGTSRRDRRRPSFSIRVLPTFRPDKAMAVESPHGLQRLGRSAGRAKRHRHRRRFRPLSRGPAAAARFLPRGRLPAVRPRPRHVLRGRLYAGGNRGRCFAALHRGESLSAAEIAQVQVGHALRIGG